MNDEQEDDRIFYVPTEEDLEIQSHIFDLLKEDLLDQYEIWRADIKQGNPHAQYDWLILADIKELAEEDGWDIDDDALRHHLGLMQRRKLVIHASANGNQEEGWKLKVGKRR